MKYLSLVLLSIAALGQSPGVVLSWTPSTTAGTSVTIYRASSSCSNPFIKIASGIAPSGPYTAGKLIPGGTYAFQVTAVLAGVESPPSNCITVTMPLPSPVVPASPTGLAATPQ